MVKSLSLKKSLQIVQLEDIRKTESLNNYPQQMNSIWKLSSFENLKKEEKYSKDLTWNLRVKSGPSFDPSTFLWSIMRNALQYHKTAISAWK